MLAAGVRIVASRTGGTAPQLTSCELGMWRAPEVALWGTEVRHWSKTGKTVELHPRRHCNPECMFGPVPVCDAAIGEWIHLVAVVSSATPDVNRYLHRLLLELVIAYAG